MIPKRKLIKKLNRRKQGNNNVNIQEDFLPETLMQKLKSINPNHKEQAITIIANMPSINKQLAQPAILKELINVLYQHNNSLVYQTLFAFNNLCEIQPGITKLIFDLGLDEALIKLNSSDKELLKPILIFLTTVSDDIPQKYQYLLRGVQSSLTIDHLNNDPPLVLQFFSKLRTVSFKNQMIEQIVQIYQSCSDLVLKSYALSIMMNYFSNIGKIQFIKEKFSQYLQQVLFIDLQSEYNINIKSHVQQYTNKKNAESKQKQTQFIQQEGQKPETQTKINMEVFEKKYSLLENTILGVQIIMETILTFAQENRQWEQYQEDQNNSQGEQIQQENPKMNTQDIKNSTFKIDLIQFLAKKSSFLEKYINLNFPHTQNIVYLSYHFIMNLPIIEKIKLSQMIQISIDRQFSRQITNQNSQILIDILELGLKILLKCEGNGLNNMFLINLGQQILKVNEQFKQCWIVLLQLYSITFNPQKRPVTNQQNFKVGSLLKKLLVQIPYTTLQQWRGQVIDTLFDVYSNQQFDKFFVQLGFMQLLEIILQKSNDGKKKKKFIRDVLKDIKRFMEYKRSKI